MFKMFDIPMGARHIVIEENETSPHVIGERFSQLFFPQPHKMRDTEQSLSINVRLFKVCLPPSLVSFTCRWFWGHSKWWGSIILWNIYSLDINLSLMSGSDIIHSSEKGKMTPNEGSRGAFEWISRGEKSHHNWQRGWSVICLHG